MWSIIGHEHQQLIYIIKITRNLNTVELLWGIGMKIVYLDNFYSQFDSDFYDFSVEWFMFYLYRTIPKSQKSESCW